jgi:hypothetical protein
LLTNGRRFADAAFAIEYAAVSSDRIIAAMRSTPPNRNGMTM